MTALGRAMSTKSEQKRELEREHAHMRKQVLSRCSGVCEVDGCLATATDWAHLFGRRHIIAEPWCSTPELTLGLCRPHHNSIDRGLDENLRETLRWAALVSFAKAYGIPLTLLAEQRDSVAGARWCERYLQTRRPATE